MSMCILVEDVTITRAKNVDRVLESILTLMTEIPTM